MMWYQLVKPFLFALDPEYSHDLTFSVLKFLNHCGAFSQKKTFPHEINCMGLKFPNPIGLGAGLDKNGDCLSAWAYMGFGFIEIGTITPKPQNGNPKPRLFRLPSSYALINRMGFNNKGVDYLIEKLNKKSFNCPVGVNIGKNRDTSLLLAHEDYLYCFRKVYQYADYVTVNLSSPNTPGLKDLQHGESLKSIIVPLKMEQNQLSDKFGKKVPLLVKISPDLLDDELKSIIDILMGLEIDGVIATNTTLRRDNIEGHHAKEEGGLSGKPLFNPSTQIVKSIYQQTGDKLPIIAIGGVMSALDAKEKFKAGAKLIQLYTGLIYRGPGLVEEIAKSLSSL